MSWRGGVSSSIKAISRQGLTLSFVILVMMVEMGFSLSSISVYTDSSEYAADGKVNVFFSGPGKGNYRISVVGPDGQVAFDEYGWISPRGNGYTYVTGLSNPGKYTLLFYLGGKVASQASFTVSSGLGVCLRCREDVTTTTLQQAEPQTKRRSRVEGSSLTTDKDEYAINDSVFIIVFAPVRAQINLSIERDGYVTYFGQEGTTILEYAFIASSPGKFSIQAVVFDGTSRADLSKTIRVKASAKPASENVSIGVGGEEHYANQPIEIAYNAPYYAVSSITVIEPDGSVNEMAVNHSGGFTFSFVPLSTGKYSVLAKLLSPYRADYSSDFTVLPPLAEGGFINLSTDKEVYTLGEQVQASLSAPSGAFSTISVREPSGFHATVESGSLVRTFAYKPSSEGDYAIVAQVQLQSENLTVEKTFLVVLALNATSPQENETSIALPRENATFITPQENITDIPIGNETALIENATHENATTEETFANETAPTTGQNLSPVRNIPDIIITKDGFKEINLSEYFTLADYYEAPAAENITFTLNEDMLRVEPMPDYTGEAKVTVLAFLQAEVYTFNETSNETAKALANVSAESNEFSILVVEGAGVSIGVQQEAEIGKPVLWKKAVRKARQDAVKVELPKETLNATVRRASGGEVSADLSNASGETAPKAEEGWLAKSVRQILEFTGLKAPENKTAPTQKLYLEISDNETDFEVEYYTPAPEASEEKTPLGKRIRVTGPDLGYKDILTYSEIPDEWHVSDPGSIYLNWLENASTSQRKPHDFTASDSDGDGYIDRVEWVTPHLSTQEFELIVITKAEHLDENMSFISDIYNEVRNPEGVWSEAIRNGEYVRVTFAKKLKQENDITIYARNTPGLETRVDVYTRDGGQKVAEFPTITGEGYYKVLLDELSNPTDTFDLKVVNMQDNPEAYLEFDYIVDPTFPGVSGMLAYQQVIYNSTAVVRNWSGSAWSAVANATNDVPGIIYWVVLKENPVREEKILGTLDDLNNTVVQIYSGGAWSTATMTTNSPVKQRRAFYIGVEHLSGDVMVVYSNNTAGYVNYNIWDGQSWAGETPLAFNASTTVNAEWIKLVEDPNSDRMLLLIQTAVTTTYPDLYVIPWNGTGWNNSKYVSAQLEVATHECFDAAFEGLSGDAIVAYADRALVNVTYNNFSFTEGWSNPSNARVTGSTATINEIRLASYPGTDRIMMCYIEGGTNYDLDCIEWDGDAWATGAGVDTSMSQFAGKIGRMFDVAPILGTDGFLVMYGDQAEHWFDFTQCNTTARCQSGTWNARSIWNTVPIGQNTSWGQLHASPGEPGKFTALMLSQNESYGWYKGRMNCTALVCSVIETPNSLNATVNSTFEGAMFAYDEYDYPKIQTNLSIWDEADAKGGSGIIHLKNSVTFCANYTNVSNGAAINSSVAPDANCTINIYNVSAWTGWYYMNYSAAQGIYYYNFTGGFNSTGIYAYNVSCNASGYQTYSLNSTIVITAYTNLSIWDDGDSKGGGRTILTGGYVAFYANYTNTTGYPVNTTVSSDANCTINIYNVSAWTGWIPMNYSAAPRWYYFNMTAGFSVLGTYDWNVSCNATGYDRATSNDTILVLGYSNLTIFDDTKPEAGSRTIYPGDYAVFYANYTNTTQYPINSTTSPEANCSINIYNVSAWTGWIIMNYSSATRLYYFNMTSGFSTFGTYAYNVTCNATYYQSKYANTTITITNPNEPPTVNSVNLHDADGGTIQLTAGSDTNLVYCDATVTDNNGWQDVKAAWSYLMNGTGINLGAASPNFKYINNSCNLTRGSGITIYANCSFLVEHEAMNGTWTCNISANDTFNANGSASGTNTIDSLVGISIFESLINFGSMTLGQMSGTNKTSNVTNQGNVIIDVKVNGSNYTCTQAGIIPVNNTRYSVTQGNYSNMANNLPFDSSQATETTFDLGVEGIVTATNIPSWKNEFWNIWIPATGVGGSCTNQIQITGTYGGP